MRSQQWLVAVLYFSKWFILLDQVLELDAYIEHSHDFKIACFRKGKRNAHQQSTKLITCLSFLCGRSSCYGIVQLQRGRVARQVLGWRALSLLCTAKQYWSRRSFLQQASKCFSSDYGKIALALEAIGMSGGSRLPFRGREEEDDEETLVIFVILSTTITYYVFWYI